MNDGHGNEEDDFVEPTEEERTNALDLVKLYLKRFYHDEPDNYVASTHAMSALTPDWRERWKTAVAFRIVVHAVFPAGLLKELVEGSANRRVRDDEQAREYLQKVYDLSMLDAAINFDDLV